MFSWKSKHKSRFYNYYEAKVVHASDYYPFGWEMPGRKYSDGVSIGSDSMGRMMMGIGVCRIFRIMGLDCIIRV